MSDDGLREDTWLTDAQLAKCARADTELFPSPIPTQLVSNGEWMPMPRPPSRLGSIPAASQYFFTSRHGVLRSR